MTELHWRIIANLGFKFHHNLPRIAFAVHAGASTELFIVQWPRGKGSSPGRVEGSSRAMLATARPSCLHKVHVHRRLSRSSALRYCNPFPNVNATNVGKVGDFAGNWLPWQRPLSGQKTKVIFTSGSAMAEGPRDALVSRNFATTKHPI